MRDAWPRVGGTGDDDRGLFASLGFRRLQDEGSLHCQVIYSPAC